MKKNRSLERMTKWVCMCVCVFIGFDVDSVFVVVSFFSFGSILVVQRCRNGYISWFNTRITFLFFLFSIFFLVLLLYFVRDSGTRSKNLNYMHVDICVRARIRFFSSLSLQLTKKKKKCKPVYRNRKRRWILSLWLYIVIFNNTAHSIKIINFFLSISWAFL